MTAAPLRRATGLDVARLLLVGAIWGASFLFIALALSGFGPLSIAALRVALAGVVLVALSALMKQAMPKGMADWRRLAVIGVLNSALPYFLIGWGQQYISSAESALMLATATFFTLFFSHFSTRDERINGARVLGVCVGFSGVLLLVVTELFFVGLGGFKGQLAVILAGASYAASTVLARRVAHLPPISTSAVIMVIASAYMLPLAIGFEQLHRVTLEWVPVLSILFLGVVATAMAFALRFVILRHNGAVFMSQVGYLVPLFGVIWSWLFLAESVAAQTWFALGCIVVGILITRTGTQVGTQVETEAEQVK